MKTRIIRITIGLTALVTSFLPQKAQAVSCTIICPFGTCTISGPDGTTVYCGCVNGYPICESS